MPTSSAETRAPKRVTLIPVTFLNGAWVWDEHARQPQPGIPYATAVEYVRADLASAENAGGEALAWADWEEDAMTEASKIIADECFRSPDDDSRCERAAARIFARIRALLARGESAAGEKEAEDERIPPLLFDGWSVYSALDEHARSRTSAENVADVLDTIVRLLREQRAARPTPESEHPREGGEDAPLA